MKQIVQAVSGGPVRIADVPRPTISTTEVLVQTIASALSPGTERAVTKLARANLVTKARARPDLVRQVIRKARTEGISQTVRAVRGRLAEDLPLGYSACGIAREVGEAVADIAPGQLVATGGAGKACHAEFQAVPGLLCARVPDDVSPETAAFTTIGSIALHALRLAEVGPGAKVGVVGLGLVGQLASRVARAAGCDVAGIDVTAFPIERARAHGALALQEEGETTTKAILDWSRGRGCDAVLVTAGGASSKAIMRTPAIARDRAVLVVVGDVGLSLERTPFYEKELTLRFARSYGPGRYEQSYEDWGVDYPPGHIRWTEGRNMEAILDLLASGALRVDDLISHRFPIADAPDAYKLIDKGSEPYLGILLTYSQAPVEEKPIRLRATRPTKSPRVGLIGAGAFASSVLVPSMKKAGFERFVSVASASGLSARRLGERFGFEKAVSGADAVIDDPEVDVVVIATPHDSHATLTARALRAGKHVFCEKPLALSTEELDDVEAAVEENDGVLFVGFNRRWSKPIAKVREHFSSGTGPLVITYRVNAGPIPEGHWYHDRRHGGRLIGEVCHFVDTCGAIAEDSATLVHASAYGNDETLLADNVIVSLSYRDGSIATIQYVSLGNPHDVKEKIEVLGRGRSAKVIDFRKVDAGTRITTLRPQDKGHVSMLIDFKKRCVIGGMNPEPFLLSMRTTLEAARQVRGGLLLQS